MYLGQAIGFVDPETPARQRHHAGKRTDTPLRINTNNANLRANAFNMARQQVLLRPRSADFEQAALFDQRRQGA